MKQIVCVVIPYFVAQVEKLSNFTAHNKPLILCADDKVYSVSESAARAGVMPGMPLRKVRVLCPDADLRTPRTVLYRQTYDAVLNILLEFTHRVESAAPILRTVKGRTKFKLLLFGTDDGLSAVVYIDLEDLKASDAHKLAGQMIDSIQHKTKLFVSIGIAQGKFPARIAATYAAPGSVHLVPADTEAEFLAQQPVTCLPVEPSVAEQLHLLGIQNLGQLAGLPVRALNAQFGKLGVLLSQLARGEDSRSVIPQKPRGTVQVVHQFESSITDSQTLEAVLSVLADELSEKLDAKGSAAGYIELTFQTEKMPYERTLPLARPASIAGHLLTVLLEMFHAIPMKSGVTSITITLSKLTPQLGRQLELQFNHKSREHRLRDKLRDVVNKYGPECFAWIELHPEARLPEHAFKLRSVS